MGYPQFLKAEVDRLKSENERLTKENEMLKKMFETTLYYGAWDVQDEDGDEETVVRVSSKQSVPMRVLGTVKEILSKDFETAW